MDKSQQGNKICISCKRPFQDMKTFEVCEHNICSVCLYERIFVNHIQELQGQNYLKIKCPCEKGFIEQDIQDIIKIIEVKSSKNYAESKEIFEEVKNCPLHKGQISNHFCLDCYTYLCEKCISNDKKFEHECHRMLPLEKLTRFIIENIKKITLKSDTLESFKGKCDEIGNKFKLEIEKNFNRTVKHIDSFIKYAIDFRDTYIIQYKEQLKNYIQTFKTIKIFYMNYYQDRNLVKEEKGNYRNLYLLRYLNNVSCELKDFELKHSQDIDKKFDEFKRIIEILKGSKIKYLRGNFIFEPINKSFLIEEKIIYKAHDKYVSTMIGLKNNKIITGSNDYKMKVWADDENGSGYRAIQTINAGKILSILALRNGRLLSSCQNNNNILVWEDKGGELGYENTQSLTNHDDCIVSMAELTDGRIISGSADCKVFIWEEENNQYIVKQKITSEKNPIYLVASLFECKLAFSSDNGIINLWAANENFKEDRIKGKELGFIQALQGHKSRVSCICQLNNGYLASGGMDNKGKIDHQIIIWRQVGKGYKISQILLGHEADINSIIELRDRKLASASKDRTIRIWKIRKIADKKIVYSLSEKLRDYGHGLYKLIQLDDDRICATASDNNIVFWRNRNCIL